MLNPFQAIRGLLNRRERNHLARIRRRILLNVESLESRRVLSAAGPLPSIIGTVYADTNASGSLDAGEGIPGAEVFLYADDGDGTFGSGDVMMGSQITDANGEYCFDSLDQDTTYFVRQTPQSVGGNTLAEKVSGPISVRPQLIVDSFQTTQTTAAFPPPVSNDESSLSFPDEVEVLGAERDLAVQLQAGTSEVQLRVNPFGLDDVLLFDSSAGTSGIRQVTWDGLDGDGDGLGFGLNGRDLTQGGQLLGFTTKLGVDANGANAIFRLYQGSETNFSEATVGIPVTGGAATDWIFLPFTNFSGPVDASNVDAIQLIIETGNRSVDGQIDMVGILGPVVTDFSNDVQIDLELTKTVDATEVNNGETVTWTLSLLNNAANANTTATGVVITDTVPSAVTVVSSNATNGTYADGIWTLSDPVAPGETETLTLVTTVNPGIAGGTLIENVAEVTQVDQEDFDSIPANDDGDQSEDDEDSAEITVARVIDLELAKVADKSTVNAGDEVTFTVTVTNNAATANTSATGVEISDSIPPGMTISNATVSGNGSFTDGRWTLVDPLAPGASQTLTIVATVDDGAQGDSTLKNVAEVVAANESDVDSQPANDDGDQSEDDEANAMVMVGAVIDLELNKNANVTNANNGDTVIWTVELTNNQANANAAATNVEVADMLPSGVTLIGAMASGNGTFSNGTWALVDPLQPGSGATLTLTTVINNSPRGGDQLTNTAQVTAADQADVDSQVGNDDGDQSEDDEDLAVVLVDPQIDLELQKTADATNVTVGDTVNWTITITNNAANANADATGVQVGDLLPTGVTFVSASASSGSFAGGTWTLGGPLAPGDSETLSIVSTVNSSAGDTIQNVAEVIAANEPDIDSTPGNDDGDQSEDDEDSVRINVTPLTIDLELSKTVSTAMAMNGDQVTWTITLTNNPANANTNATGVQVTDVLPAGVTLVSSAASSGTFAGSIWTLGGPLVPGAMETLSIVTSVDDSAAGGDVLTNIAQVTAANEDDVDSAVGNDDGDQSEDDEDNAQVTVVEVIDVEIDKTVNANNVSVGDTVIWTITVRNNPAQANTAATGVTVSDVLPGGVEFVSATTSNGTYNNATGIWTLSSPLAPGDSATLTVVSTVSAGSAGASLLNVAEVAEHDQQDIDSVPGNDDGDQSEDDEDPEQINVAPERPPSKRDFLASS